MPIPDRETIRKVVVEVLARWLEKSQQEVKSHNHLRVLSDGDATAQFRDSIKHLAPYFATVEQNKFAGSESAIILLEDISPQCAADLATGVCSTQHSQYLLEELSKNTPVWVASPVDRIPAPFAEANPAVTRILRANRYNAKTLGIRFSPETYIQEIIAYQTPEINLTPQRLAQVRPWQKRQFLTTEDVYEARMKNRSAIPAGPNTTITDEAKELAQQFGIGITAEN